MNEPRQFRSGQNEPKSKPMRKRSIIAGLALVAALGLFTGGCSLSNKDMGHIITARGVGTGLGATQNPATGMYELALKRIQEEITWIPVVFSTNNTTGAVTAVIPDTVTRYEVSTASAVWGDSAITSTTATGLNGVLSNVGGATPPINSGKQTNSVSNPNAVFYTNGVPPSVSPPVTPPAAAPKPTSQLQLPAQHWWALLTPPAQPEPSPVLGVGERQEFP